MPVWTLCNIVKSYQNVVFMWDLTRTHRLQQGLQVAELLISQPRLHLDFTDDPLESLKSELNQIQTTTVIIFQRQF